NGEAGRPLRGGPAGAPRGVLDGGRHGRRLAHRPRALAVTVLAVRELVVPAPGACVVSETYDELGDRSVQVDVLYSGISLGTEMSISLGTNPRLQLADVGPGDAVRTPPLRYPARGFGYMQVGRIVTAPGHEHREGELVALRCGHRTAFVQDVVDGL